MHYEGGGPADPFLRPAQVNGAATVGPLRASPTFTLHGKLYVRRQGFWLESRLTCPLSHRVKKKDHIHDAGARLCTSKVGATEECGALVYVFPLIFPGLGEDRLYVWGSDVVYDEVVALERMKFCDRLAYLGALMPEWALLRRA